MVAVVFSTLVTRRVDSISKSDNHNGAEGVDFVVQGMQSNSLKNQLFFSLKNFKVHVSCNVIHSDALKSKIIRIWVKCFHTKVLTEINLSLDSVLFFKGRFIRCFKGNEMVSVNT